MQKVGPSSLPCISTHITGESLLRFYPHHNYSTVSYKKGLPLTTEAPSAPPPHTNHPSRPSSSISNLQRVWAPPPCVHPPITLPFSRFCFYPVLPNCPHIGYICLHAGLRVTPLAFAHWWDGRSLAASWCSRVAFTYTWPPPCEACHSLLYEAVLLLLDTSPALASLEAQYAAILLLDPLTQNPYPKQ